MKILHVIANLAPRYGGPPKACQEMAQAVAERGHEVTIYTTDQDGLGRLDVPLDWPVRDGLVQIRYFPSSLRTFWPVSLPMARALARDISTFDIVHIHSLYLFHGAVTAHYCRKYNVPYLMRPHGTLDPYIYNRHRSRKNLYEWLIERRNLSGAAAIHFTSEEERQLAQPYLSHLRGVVVPLGINLEDYTAFPAKGTFRDRYPRIGDSKIVLYLGRLNFKKGLDILVEAISDIVRTDRKVHLVIAGLDNIGYGRKVKGWVDACEIGDKVTFTGLLLGQDKLAAFRDADVFALPSHSENFGIAVVEAMACGLPVVISDRVNIWQEVKRAGAGTVTSLDPDEVAKAILELVSNQNMRHAAGEAGRRLVAEKYQWDEVASQLERVYEDISNGNYRSRN